MPRKNPRPQARMRREVLKAKMRAKANAKANAKTGPQRVLTIGHRPTSAFAILAALTARKPD